MENRRSILQRQKRQRNRRLKCCWNCFNKGHLRFQCPEPKRISCSFCRKPNILSSDCACQTISLHPIEVHEIQAANYNLFVELPRIQPDEARNVDNLVIVIENPPNPSSDEEVDLDILEIHPEDDCLDDI